MENQFQNIFFEVDASDVQVSSRTPLHLAKRFKMDICKDMPRTYVMNQQQAKLLQAEKRRQSHLKLRKERCTHLERIHRASQVREEKEMALEKMVQESIKKTEHARHLRELRLQRKQERCAAHWRHTLHVCRKASEQEQQWRRSVARKIYSKMEVDQISADIFPLRKETAMVPSKEDAAVIIQRQYRLLKFREACRLFSKTKLGKKLSCTKSLSFNELASLVRSKSVLRATEGITARIKVWVPEPLNSRVFLSIFMFALHPEAVFEKIGQTESILQTLSNNLLFSMENFTNDRGFTIENVIKFCQAVAAFQKEFENWRSEDLKTLIASMKAQHEELSLLFDKVNRKAAPQQSSDEWNPRIFEQQALIERKLRKVGAIDEADRLEAVRCQNMQRKQQEHARRSKRKRTLSNEVPTEVSKETTEKSSGPGVSETPQLVKGLINAELAHEIALDENFTLPSALESSKQAVQEAAAITAHSLSSMMDPASQENILAFLKTTNEALCACTLPKQDAVRQRIHKSLDTDLYRQQLQAGVFSQEEAWEKICYFIKLLCAPIRDDEVAAVTQSMAFSNEEGICQLMNLLDSMKLDLANFLISQFRPLIKQHVFEIESEHFRTAFENNTLSQELTVQWLQNAVDVLPPTDRNAMKSFWRGIQDLLFGDAEIPETLKMDENRIRKWKEALKSQTRLATVLTLACTAVPSLKSHPQLMKELVQSFQREGFIGFMDVIDRQCWADQSVSYIKKWAFDQDLDKHPVSQLLKKRMATEVIRFLEQTADDQTFVDLKRNTGLDQVHVLMTPVLQEMQQVFAHNRKVFAFLYDKILDKLLQ